MGSGDEDGGEFMGCEAESGTNLRNYPLKTDTNIINNQKSYSLEFLNILIYICMLLF